MTGDFNKDGHTDFVVANGGTDDLWLYPGKGDGTFELPQIIPLTKGMTPVYLAAADLRGIGVLDLIVAEFDTSTVGVLLGNGDGTFGFEQEYVLPQPPSALVVGDFNRDGKLDIVSVMVTFSSQTLGVQYLATLLGDGTGSFSGPLISMNPDFYSTATTIAAGDVNNDGFPDVLISGPGLENSQVYLGVGDGTFTPGSIVVENGDFNLILAGTLADVNQDGCLDGVVADGNGGVWVAAGDCSGNFGALTYVPMGDSNSAVSVVDMNGDGHLDIVTTTIPLLDPSLGDLAGNMIAVAFGDGHGNFTAGRDYVGTGLSYSLAVADFNGDGHPDVVSASPDTDTATVYLNDGSADFGFPQGEWIGAPGTGGFNSINSAPSFADVNGDGKPDVVLLDDGDFGEYFITTLLNDGTGKFASPVSSDAGIAFTTDLIDDYRLGDFRNTGHLDFLGIGYVVNSTTNAQFVLFAAGNGDGTFGTPTLTMAPQAVGLIGVGDFNHDGKLDFVAVGYSSTGTGMVVNTFLGNGNGTFRFGGSVPFTDSATNLDRVFVADVNRDGKLDILVYISGPSSYLGEFLGNGDGTFQAGQQLFNNFGPMTLADLNGDSWLDIASYQFSGTPTFTTYLDQPAGSFSLSSSLTPYAGLPLPPIPYAQFGDPMASSMVADLNGDGKPDEIAFQYLGPSGDIYAQILAGNGDGTFTPTYDVFDFQKVDGFPNYAHILDGSNVSDFLEIDGATSSMHVFKGGPAPALQIALEEVQVTGNAGCGWVFPNVPSASDTSVTLSTSSSGVVLPASVTVPAGSLSQRFCYTLSSSRDWHQVFDVRAQLGSDTAIAYAWQNYVVGFSEALSPITDQVVYPTWSSAPVTVSLTSSQGYSSMVNLSCEGLLAGETCTFGSNTLAVSPAQMASTTVVVSSSATTAGSGPVVIVVSDGNVTKRQAFNLTVQPLWVDAVTTTPEATSPGSGTGEILIVGIPPFTLSCSGLPPGVTCSFSGDQLLYPSETTITVAVNVPAGVAAANYPFTVGIASGPVPASVPFNLYISDFSLQAPSSGSAWAPPGDTVTVTPTAQSINLFSSPITVTCSLDDGGSCTGGTFSVGPNGPTPINLSVSTPSSAALGAGTLTMVATSGSLTHTAAFPFYIADYSGSLSNSTLTMARGGSGTLTATVNATAGFGGMVSFACSGTTQLTCSFSPSQVQPTGTSPQTTNLTVTAGSGASKLALRGPTNSKFFLLTLMLPLIIVLGAARTQTHAARAAAGVFLLALMLAMLSCGGGSNGGGGGEGQHGSNLYTLTVTASAAGTNTTRTLGTIDVTVTH